MRSTHKVVEGFQQRGRLNVGMKSGREPIEKLRKRNARGFTLSDVLIGKRHDPKQSHNREFEKLKIYNNAANRAYKLVR